MGPEFLRRHGGDLCRLCGSEPASFRGWVLAGQFSEGVSILGYGLVKEFTSYAVINFWGYIFV